MDVSPELIKLIDEASKIAGSDAKLADLIGQPRQRISNWRHGHKDCPPEDQALMAAVAGFDPVSTLARAVVEKHEGKKKGDLLMKVLGKALLATGGVIASAGANATAIFSAVGSSTSGPGIVAAVLAAYSTMYIMFNCKNQGGSG